MPLFAGFGPLSVQVGSGTTIPLFNAETLTAPATSPVIAPVDAGPVERNAITFEATWATAPTASLSIFGSNVAPTVAGPQAGVSLAIMAAQNGSYTDTNGYAFYWAVLASQSAGGAVSVIAHVR